MTKGTLFLIPTYLSGSNDRTFIAPMVYDVLQNTSDFIVENVRTSRRFISSLRLGITIEDLRFSVLDKKASWDDMHALFLPILEGADMGLMSEAGLPCLADPGNLAVCFAHQVGIRVVPLPGASSIQMALISSGFNGQKFTFHGYLPIEKRERVKRLLELQKLCQSTGYTQLFMETPYRNEALLKDILKNCQDDQLLCIAADISGARQHIESHPIRKWKKSPVSIQKLPAIFGFGQFP